MTCLRSLLILSVATLGPLLLPQLCQAQLTYQTSYRAANGQTMTAVVSINGNSGQYRSFNVFGQPVGGGLLSNVRFVNFGGQAILRGQWRWNTGGQGTFLWYLSNNLSSFHGHWQSAGGGGRWNGSLSGGSGQLGQGGPFLSR
jgi:hypothetical protein